MAENPPHDEMPIPSAERASQDLLGAVLDAIEAGDNDRLNTIILDLPAEDLADILHICTPENRDAIMSVVREHLDPEVLPLLDDSVREDVIEQMNASELAQAVTA